MTLPKGWVLASNDELGEFINGVAFKPADWGTEGVPIVRIQNLTDPNRPFNKTLREIDERYHLERGDILVSWSATLDVFIWNGPHAYVNQHIFKVVPSPALDSRFVFFALKLSIAELKKSEHLHGTTMKHVNRKPFLAHPIPLAPLNEQRRIVEKIETLFARLDKGEEAVQEVQKLLTRYRQSVLKSAVTGQLTADWRAERAGQLEHGRDLLARILQTRRENWQGRGKYKEPAKSDTSDLPDPPEGWVWAKMEQLFEVFGGATPSRREPDNWGGSIPWVSSGEVAFCRITETNETISEVGYASCSTKLHPPGTVLLAMIGEGKTRGQAAILDIAACNNQNAAAIRVPDTEIPPEFIYFYLLGNYEANRLKGQGGNQPALSGGKVKNFDVPVCSIEEIREITRQVEERLPNVDAMEVWCQTELKRSASLRQSILKDAFAGRLVPQDPSDKPASELLARIKAADTDAPKRTRRRATE